MLTMYFNTYLLQVCIKSKQSNQISDNKYIHYLKMYKNMTINHLSNNNKIYFDLSSLLTSCRLKNI